MTECVASAIEALLAMGMPPEALLDLAAMARERVETGRPGPVELVAHVGPRRITGACVREERHYPAPLHSLGR